MKLLKGKPIADAILADVKKRAAGLARPPRLVVVQVGENPVSVAYIERKKRTAENVGIELRVKKFPEDISTKQLRNEISSIAHHKRTTGIIVQLPLPKSVRTQYVLDAIPLSKDVDGLSSKNMGKLATGREAMTPPTAAGIVRLLDHFDIAIQGKHVVMVGSGRLVGRPTGLLFLAKGATVTFTDEHTVDIQSIVRTADIVVVGAGHPNLVDADWINENAVVIDAGSTIIDGKIVGDVDQEHVAKKATALTPVPGGIGPLTIAMLFSNVIHAAE